jgi:hypothetical protein
VDLAAAVIWYSARMYAKYTRFPKNKKETGKRRIA